MVEVLGDVKRGVAQAVAPVVVLVVALEVVAPVSKTLT